MFSLFGKRRSSPVDDNTPPIPGPRSDEGFEIIDPGSRGNVYPNVSGLGGPAFPYPQRPAPPTPVQTFARVDSTFHYLQGVPFHLAKELQMASNKDAYAAEITDMISFLTSRLNMSGYSYDFTVEKSVLNEC